ncbi:collagen alpha-1(I) chain-like [Ammospiza nelsoni]|uniref:collagen alpha-1(I) chain-like n=1 Tax=Ammospiza nelsoni TaxID=2857394 RepID=UPI002869A5CC|nr:collagen alpha-1(I) chain-like [Ammospiza nelsoni]
MQGAAVGRTRRLSAVGKSPSRRWGPAELSRESPRDLRSRPGPSGQRGREGDGAAPPPGGAVPPRDESRAPALPRFPPGIAPHGAAAAPAPPVERSCRELPLTERPQRSGAAGLCRAGSGAAAAVLSAAGARHR